MDRPICPGCKKPMKKEETFGPNAYECIDGCGDWYWTPPDEEVQAEVHQSTE